MKRTPLMIALSFMASLAMAQDKNQLAALNLGFEKIDAATGKAIRWNTSGNGYIVGIDTTEKHSGKASMKIEGKAGKPGNAFGFCGYIIPAIYEGDKIELRAYMKFQDVKDGAIGLMLRLDNRDSTLQFDNMLQHEIQGTRDWGLFSVTLPLPKDAKNIAIGGILSGTGTLWADDFEILIDGKNIAQAKIKAPAKFKADLDSQFNKGSAIAAIPLDARRINDLTVLGKVWGFVKYYHPAVCAGEYNWDYELFRVLPKVMQCNNDQERNEILYTWIKQLGEFKTDKAKQPDSARVKLYPDLQWINDVALLGAPLSAQLNEIRNAKRKFTGYYLDIGSAANPEFKNENNYAATRYPDAGQRLLAVYRYWNIIQYFFPYKNLIGENWNNVLAEFIPKMTNAGNELEYKQAVLAMIARVHDSHASFWSVDPALEQNRGKYYVPLAVRFIEGKAVVTGYANEILGPETGLKKGDIVTAINGKPMESIVKDNLPFTPASNYATQLRNMAGNLLRTNDTSMTISYQRGSMVQTAKLPTYPRNVVYTYKEKKDTCFKYITPEIAYIYPGTIKKEYVANVMPGFMQTKGMIIDMRCYPSDAVFPMLCNYLLPQETRFCRITNADLVNPGYFIFTHYNEVGSKNPSHYKGRIVIIVNEVTQSAAEYMSMALRVAPQATVIGSTTAAADGNVSFFYLPGGVRTGISAIGVYYPDGRETQRVGIVPDITVQPTIQGIAEGRDEVLEKAIAIINGK